MSQHYTSGRYKSFLDSGAANANGRLYTYVSGTTTHKAAYTDAGLGTPCTYVADGSGNLYIALNSRGETQVWLGNGPYTMVDATSIGVTISTIDGVEDPESAVLSVLSASDGDTKVGFQQVGSALTRSAHDKLLEVSLSVADYPGDDPTQATPSDSAIQAAIDEASSLGGGSVFVPGPRTFGTITPKSNVRLWGTPSLSKLTQVQPNTDTQTGIYKQAGGGSLSNFEISGITFDGARLQNPTHQANDMIAMYADANETVSDIRIKDCHFQDAQNNFIAFYISATTGYVRDVTVERCSFITTPGNRFTTGTAAAGGRNVSQDAVRLQQTYDILTSGNGYGQVVYSNCRVLNCRAESIRTLVDFKRGGKDLFASDCFTLNMYDTHESIDGCFDVEMRAMIGWQQASYTGPSDDTDFIEAQGERISIHGFHFDGGGAQRDGVYITAYGTPQEPNNKGHQPVAVNVFGGTILNCTGIGYRLEDGTDCSFHDAYAVNCGRVADIESGSTRTDGTSLTAYLNSQNSFVGRIQNNGCTNGVLFSTHCIASRYAACMDQNGQDFYDVGTVPPGGAAGGNGSSSNAINAPYLNESYRELGPNPLMGFYGGSSPLYFSLINSATTSTSGITPPIGVAVAFSVTDADGTNIAGLQLSPAIPLTQSQRLYIRVSAQYNNSAIWSIQVDEYNTSGTLLASYFYGQTAFNLSGGGWNDYDVGHIAQNSTCARVKITLNPAAAASTDGTHTGLTNFANLRISHTAIGVI